MASVMILVEPSPAGPAAVVVLPVQSSALAVFLETPCIACKRAGTQPGSVIGDMAKFENNRDTIHPLREGETRHDQLDQGVLEYKM